MFIKKILPFFLAFAFPLLLNAQVTFSGLSGFVKTAGGEALPGATVTATHVPTGTVYRVVTKNGGKFDINNMIPGGAYTIDVSFVNFETFKREEVFLTLGENSRQDFQLGNKTTQLTVVSVTGSKVTQGKGGTETTIGRDRMTNLPTVGRNITDFLRATPQAKYTSTEGAISIAGQNNRYNAFYVDGALNNDVFGLAASGTNGGQANVAPISIDAIDQIQVVISPFDASLSGFTGGGINAITRSGTNTVTGSVYYTFRNEKLSGKTPTGDKSVATRFGKFDNKTYGFRVGGPIIKNKIFYFLSAEVQRDERPQQFDTSLQSNGQYLYRGVLKPSEINALADTIRLKYGYDPGGWVNNPETINADRVTAKVDWKVNDKNRFSLAYRYNFGERYNTSSTTTSNIHFYNDGVYQPSKSHYVSAELRSNFGKSKSNRLLLTYAHIDDDRGPIGNPFPRVALFDGPSGTINFGSDNSSTVNLLTQRNFNLLDIFRFSLGKHSFSVGTDNEWNKVYNAFIQNTFGNYQYATIPDFLTNAKPRQYIVGYSLLDSKNDATASAADFTVARIAGFISDEWRPNEKLTVTMGIRADKFSFITTPGTDSFTNAVAIPKFAQYYDLHGAMSGQKPKMPVSISPRLGFTFRVPEDNVTIRGGVGYFTGRIPLVWPGGIYNNNGFFQGGFTSSSTQNPNALNIIRFRADPNNQYKATDVGISISKGGLNLVSKEFHLPKVFKASLAFEKQLGNGWTGSIEGLFTKNIIETYYTNINIVPPIGVSVAPGSRNVYPAPNVISIINGTSPYDNAILLSNAPKGKTGFSYDFTFTLDKRFQNGLAFNINYTYGNATVIHEPTSSVNLSQWRFIETVNGRNYIDRSTSDFDLGHRIFAFASKKFTYLNKSLATTISLVYNGQTGSAFSYTYGTNSAVRDDANAATTNDLMYIPTQADLASAIFLSNTIGTTTYTPQQQKDALEAYIQANKYLSKHRGEFAGRNEDRMPFQNILDLSIKQDVSLKVSSKRRIAFQVGYDVFNFTNMINRNWGRTYFLSNDQMAVINFAGYVSATNLTPQYRFNPTLNQPQAINNISTTSAPSFSARWNSQVSLRFNF